MGRRRQSDYRRAPLLWSLGTRTSLFRPPGPAAPAGLLPQVTRGGRIGTDGPCDNSNREEARQRPSLRQQVPSSSTGDYLAVPERAQARLGPEAQLGQTRSPPGQALPLSSRHTQAGARLQAPSPGPSVSQLSLVRVNFSSARAETSSHLEPNPMSKDPLPSPSPRFQHSPGGGGGARGLEERMPQGVFTLVFVPQSWSDGHGGRLTPFSRRLTPFSRSSPKSQATNLGELERKLIKYTSRVSTATGVRWKPPPAAANDQVHFSRTKQSGALLPSWNRLQDPVVSLGLAGQGFVFRRN